MKRVALASAVTVLSAVLAAPALLAQAKPGQAPATKASAPTAAQTPAAPAKFAKIFKGIAEVWFVQGIPKRIGPDIVTTFKLKNMSPGAISLLKIDEYWYNKRRLVATGDSVTYRKPFNPGEIIELTLRSPWKPDLVVNQYQFSQANGTVKPTKKDKFN